jgi:hypothetical protein
MSISSKQGLVAVFLSASMIVGGAACGDDDSVDNTASDAGDSDSGGKAGAGATGGKGSAGKGGTGGSSTAGKGGHSGSHTAAGSDAMSEDDAGVAVAADSQAADLRVTLNLLLSEHLIIASKATGAALGGRADEFEAYGELLNQNGSDMGALIKAAFGDEAETKFNGIWSAHNGFFVDYTQGAAADDQAKQDKAVKDLLETYVPQFAELISGATGLPQAKLEELTKEHVISTKAIVDAQKAENWSATYGAIRAGFAHMAMLGDPLAEAIAAKLPNKFPGDNTTKAVSFRVALNELLQEHLYLASFATGAALGGRTDEFSAAGAALNANGTDIGAAIRGLYNAEAETTFNGIWSAHNGFFVDYTQGVAADDTAEQEQAVKALTEQYVPDFAAFLHTATDLPTNALAELTTEHVLTTKAIVDAQGADDVDEAKVASEDRHAGQHMQMLGDPLSAAIIKKLPAKF